MLNPYRSLRITVAAAMAVLAGGAAAQAAPLSVLFNFGATVNNDNNSAMHEDGGVTGTNWNLITTADITTGIVSSTGAATSIKVDLGTGNGTSVNWASQPSSAATLGSVFNTGIYAGNGKSCTYVGSGELGIRISGLPAGTYNLFISGRNTNATNTESHRYYFETVAAASGSTAYSTANSFLITYESKTDFLANTPNTWDLDIDYGIHQYTIADGEDIVIAASGRGFVATLGIIAVVPEPASIALFAIGGLLVASRRRNISA